MNTKIIVKETAARGRRINATPESDIPEEVKLEVKREETETRRKRRGKVFAIIGTVLVWLPLLFPIYSYIASPSVGIDLPFAMYPFLILRSQFWAILGGLFLYLGARATNTLRKPIGWLTIVMFVVLFTTSLTSSKYTVSVDPSSIPAFVVYGMIISQILMLLCMLALNVFSVLLLKRIYKKAPVSPEINEPTV